MTMKQFPVQIRQPIHSGAKVNESVYMATYEVYSHVYGPQVEMIQGNCRGGFSAGEIIAFLYARSFPKEQWLLKVEEAWKDMEQL